VRTFTWNPKACNIPVSITLVLSSARLRISDFCAASAILASAAT
jgi:hypothetical protein